jgi:hypothetical protein
VLVVWLVLLRQIIVFAHFLNDISMAQILSRTRQPTEEGEPMSPTPFIWGDDAGGVFGALAQEPSKAKAI